MKVLGESWPGMGLSWSRLADLAASMTEGSYRRCAWLLLAIFGLVALCLTIQGAPPIGNPWDVMMLLDAAWRILSGQIAYIDFDNPLGPLTYLLIVVGMRAGGPSTAAITYGTVLFSVLVVPWAWRIARARFPAAMAFIFVLLIGFLLLAPRPLSQPVHETSYAMYYNREGYALLSLLWVSLFLEPRGSRKPRWEAISNGLLLGLLLYCKITYFVFGVASLAFAAVSTRRVWRALPGMAIGAAAIAIFFLATLNIDLREYLSDVASAGRSQSLAMRLQLLRYDLLHDVAPAYILLLCAAIWRLSASPEAIDSSGVARAWRPLLFTLWVLIVAPGVDSGNSAQRMDIEDPLYFTGGLILIEMFRRSAFALSQGDSRQQPALPISLLILIPLVACPILVRDVATVAYSVQWNLTERQHFDASRRLHSSQLSDFLVPASTGHVSSYWLARDHSANINDGIDLLQRNLLPGDRITAIAFTNPFSFALGVAPARDGPQWWDRHINFDENHHPSAETFLGDCSLVIVPVKAGPNATDFETVELMLRLYGDYLQANFRLIDQSSRWLLYRRKAQPT